MKVGDSVAYEYEPASPEGELLGVRVHNGLIVDECDGGFDAFLNDGAWGNTKWMSYGYAAEHLRLVPTNRRRKRTL